MEQKPTLWAQELPTYNPQEELNILQCEFVGLDSLKELPAMTTIAKELKQSSEEIPAIIPSTQQPVYSVELAQPANSTPARAAEPATAAVASVKSHIESRTNNSNKSCCTIL